MKDREKSVFDYVAKTIGEKGYSPSVRDIRDALGFKSTSTVHIYLKRLEESGLISKVDGKSRTIRIEGESTDAYRVPLLGRVTAGIPALAAENFDGYISFVDNGKYRREDLFALKVEGVSMIDAGILDGDTVVVEKTPYAENGHIVVALIGDEATVKVFYKEKGGYRLQPRNPELKPILLDEVEILGRVIADIRIY